MQRLFTIVCLALWAVAAALLPAYLLPGPVTVGGELVHLLTTAVLAWQVFISLVNVTVSVALAFSIGFGLALAAHYVRPLRLLIHHRLSPILNAFPAIGWTLIAVLWFGLTQATVIFSVTVILLPFCLVNLHEGLDTLDADVLEMARSYTRLERRTLRLVVLPLLVPFVFASLRLSFGVAWKVTLTAELLGGDSGIGYLVNLAMQEQNTARILACALLIVGIVITVDRFGFAPAQRRLGSVYRIG
ncbi:MAG: ABC transporter permease subunit [Burkholderiaceae bacterium]|nr:ABC transporter permease subunit [Burkholderiaceae bacterium]